MTWRRMPSSVERFLAMTGQAECLGWKELHKSPTACSYQIGLRGENRSHDIVLKVFRDVSVFDLESGNLSTVRRLNPDSTCVRVPETCWENRDYAMFAARWIPGADLDVMVKKEGGLLSRESPQRRIADCRAAVTWAQQFCQQGLNEQNAPGACRELEQSWEIWRRWLDAASHLGRKTIRLLLPQMLELEGTTASLLHQAGPVHGDLASWNVRIGADGHVWVLDWRKLKYGHWLESAYRLAYSLRLTGANPLVKRRYFARLTSELMQFVRSLGGDPKLLYFFELFAVMKHFHIMCRRPAATPRRVLIQRFWEGEAVQLVEGRRTGT